MNYNVLLTGRFEKELKRLIKKFPSLRQEFASLNSTLKQNPQTGKSLGHNCYKIRISIASKGKGKGKGKSGGARIITYVYCLESTIYLLSIYDKYEKETITDKELREILGTIAL